MTRKFHRIDNRHGYVLLVVIAVSVLVITALSSLAKVSLRRGLEAADAERSLRVRWGALTLEQAMMKEITTVFELQEKRYAETSPGVPPPSTIRAALTLSGVTFDMLLGDEDAKLNLNALYHTAGLEKAEQQITKVIGPTVPGTVRLRPVVQPMELSRLKDSRKDEDDASEVDDAETPEIPAAFRSWGEVFDVVALEEQAGSDLVLPAITSEITLWGNGALNIRRASDEAIVAVVSTVIQDGGASKFLKRLRSSATVTLGVVLQTEISDEGDRRDVARLISETSTNYSLWLDASTPGGNRLRTFAATRRDESGVTRHTRFAY
ncbi:hypothetical protein Poly51_12090 [Rubripirellula tenax]|uniref:General secretion pathway protein K n=1 Tax=Rubripirellula tenax TaxID=2528015 RepID=A0A5C6FFQ6_9BACT|nr:hypothetical protein [Rubripirellula tenax]TWU58431.1 hypothetical protein Poly51_12090 [Rubripirellula tenax]